YNDKNLLLVLIGHLIAIASHKLLDAAGGIDKLLLASVKRVRVSADFQVDDEVLNPIDDLCFLCLGGGDSCPLVVAIDEQNGVDLRVSRVLHLIKPSNPEIMAQLAPGMESLAD